MYVERKTENKSQKYSLSNYIDYLEKCKNDKIRLLICRYLECIKKYRKKIFNSPSIERNTERTNNNRSSTEKNAEKMNINRSSAEINVE